MNNANEYFIDRDGLLFRHIMQFYRTGKVHWPSPKESQPKLYSDAELLQEIDFFQIPYLSETNDVGFGASLAPKAAAEKIDAFVQALKDVMYEVMGHFTAEISFSFWENDSHKSIYWTDYVDKRPFVRIIHPFAAVGYNILERFGEEITAHLKQVDISFKFQKHQSSSVNAHAPFYRVYLKVTENFEREAIRNMSCLAQTKSNN